MSPCTPSCQKFPPSNKLQIFKDLFNININIWRFTILKDWTFLADFNKIFPRFFKDLYYLLRWPSQRLVIFLTSLKVSIFKWFYWGWAKFQKGGDVKKGGSNIEGGSEGEIYTVWPNDVFPRGAWNLKEEFRPLRTLCWLCFLWYKNQAWLWENWFTRGCCLSHQGLQSHVVTCLMLVVYSWIYQHFLH